MPPEPFEIGGTVVNPGSRTTVDLPISVLSNHTPMTLPACVVRGRRNGPKLFVSAVVHGDEIIGVEIIRRLLRSRTIRHLRGTLLCVPIVNAFGFINHSRYLPDRRDLNRSFPGSATGSLAARLANLFMTEIVARCDYGIDIHSAAVNRTNLPQIRVTEDSPRACELAEAFGAPIIINSRLREGSLRLAAKGRDVDVLVYEAGEGLRFDEFAVRAGVMGVLRVMKHIGMIVGKGVKATDREPVYSETTQWVRAPEGGILRSFRTIGAAVRLDEVIGMISDPFGETECEVRSGKDGLIIGRSNLPVVNQGDALFHIAQVSSRRTAETRVTEMGRELGAEPLFDEDEII